MRWGDFRRSDNVEESTGGGGGFGGMRLGGGAVIVVIIISLLLGKNPLEILALLSDGGAPQETQVQQLPATPSGSTSVVDKQKDFVTAVLGDTEDVWGDIFTKLGTRYEPPKLRLFREPENSACGLASPAMGPFYCPGNQKVYLDLAFFDELSRLGAPGEFARAYVIAHEIGHHVQNQLGLMAQVEKQSANASEGMRKALSVRQELQADCLAGVWGHSAEARGKLETGDIESGIAAATAVGDDRIQKATRGYVVPESFTHGSSAQRVRWFKVGLQTGDIRQCNTFAARDL
jgi:uncharacterized protein